MHLLLPLAAVLALAVMNARRGRDEAAAAQAEAGSKGKDFIAARSYTVEEDRAILKQFEGLRVADVSDGLDAAEVDVRLQGSSARLGSSRPGWQAACRRRSRASRTRILERPRPCSPILPPSALR